MKVEAFKKTIKLFLLDGIISGRWSCELSNWSGKAYRIPRTCLKSCEDRLDLNNTGVYFLFGVDEKISRQLVYVGEAENIFYRLKEHLTNKEYWSEVITFISKDNQLNKAHVKYLENSFFDLASKAGRYIVKNTNTPTQSSLAEADVAEMEEFIFNARILMGTLGHKVFEPLITPEVIERSDDLLYFSHKGSCEGIGKKTAEGFVVLKGSHLHSEVADYTSPGYKALRVTYVDAINEKDWTTTKDLLFSSPSAAAVFLCGKNSNGQREWKNAEGVSLKDIETEN